TEYGERIQEHYRSVLKEHGIDSAQKHYDALIADPQSSEALRQEFETQVKGDDRLTALMQKLGMGSFSGG
ncbi:hypothetical protein, partial [Endothiovibrio diazotrophicus]